MVDDDPFRRHLFKRKRYAIELRAGKRLLPGSTRGRTQAVRCAHERTKRVSIPWAAAVGFLRGFAFGVGCALALLYSIFLAASARPCAIWNSAFRRRGSSRTAPA